MKRNLSGTKITKGHTKLDKPIIWTNEQDQFLKQEIGDKALVTWRAICKKFNKEFSPIKRTSKECEARWKEMNAGPNYNEELLILLMFYKNRLQIIDDIMKPRIDVYEYMAKLLGKLKARISTLSHTKMNHLEKLQYILCIDKAFHPENILNKELEEFREAKDDWLELAQELGQTKIKPSEVNLHEFSQKLAKQIEESLSIMIESTNNDLKGLMHERKDNPSHIHVENYQDPGSQISRINVFLLANYFHHYGAND